MAFKYIPSLLADEFAKGYNIKFINENTYCWDYSLAYPDGSKRFQFVYISEIVEKEKDKLYIRSLVADYSDKLNAMQLLRDAEFCNLTCVCLKRYTKKDGTEVEGIYLQCYLPVELALQNKKMLLEIIHDVANRADAIEKLYLGTDN